MAGYKEHVLDLKEGSRISVVRDQRCVGACWAVLHSPCVPGFHLASCFIFHVLPSSLLLAPLPQELAQASCFNLDRILGANTHVQMNTTSAQGVLDYHQPEPDW